MSRNKEWKERRDKALPARLDYARKVFAQNGIQVLEETPFSLIVKVNCARIEYFPYTGGFRGIGVQPGSKGIKNLIALKK